MKVRPFVVLALFGTHGAAPQRPASHTMHILTSASLRVFERSHPHAGERAYLHTNCTFLHFAQNLHFAQVMHTLHTDAHCARSAHAHPSYLHNPHGRAAGPTECRHGPLLPLSGPATTHAATPTLPHHCTRPNGAKRAYSTRRPLTSRSNTTYPATPPPPHRTRTTTCARAPHWPGGTPHSTPALAPDRDTAQAHTALGRCAPGALTRAINELPLPIYQHSQCATMRHERHSNLTRDNASLLTREPLDMSPFRSRSYCVASPALLGPHAASHSIAHIAS